MCPLRLALLDQVPLDPAHLGWKGPWTVHEKLREVLVVYTR